MKKIILFLCLSFLLLVPNASAIEKQVSQTEDAANLDPNQDWDLTQNGGTFGVDSTYDKWGVGFDSDPDAGFLASIDQNQDSFPASGEHVFGVTFQVDSLMNDEGIIQFLEPGFIANRGLLRVLTNGSLYWQGLDGTPYYSGMGDIMPGVEYSVLIYRAGNETSRFQENRTIVELWDPITGWSTPINDTNRLGTFDKIELANAINTPGDTVQVFEVRGFSQAWTGDTNSNVPPFGELRRIMNPMDTYCANEVGDSVVLWFLEVRTIETRDCTETGFSVDEEPPDATCQMLFFLCDIVTGEATDEQNVVVIAENHLQNDTFYAYLGNATNVPIPPEEGHPMLWSINKVREERIGWWNGSGFTEQPNYFELTPIPNTSRTLWKADISGLEANDYTINVFAEANTSTPSQQEKTLSSFENVRQENMIEIAGLETSQLIELGIWGSLLLFCLLKGWILPSVAATLPLFHPIFTNAGAIYPFNFTAGVLFFVLTIWLQRYTEWFEDRFPSRR